jgi:Fe-Mn family superoxide dismutase
MLPRSRRSVTDSRTSGYEGRRRHPESDPRVEEPMAITLPELPYATDALAPYLSAETFEYHHGKHHKAYVDNLNKLIEGTPEESKSLEQIVMDAEPGPKFNNAAQIWNHNFYWTSMVPGGGGAPTGAAADAINESFGGYDAFREEFKKAAVGQFGSGWAWLVQDGGKIAVMATANADLPMKHGRTALVTCDVWEHAYYIDYRNRRPDYVDTFLDHLINWDQVNAGL